MLVQTNFEKLEQQAENVKFFTHTNTLFFLRNFEISNEILLLEISFCPEKYQFRNSLNNI